MTYYRKISVTIGLIAFTLIGIAATHPADQEKPPKRNLKVLSKNLDEDELEAIMYKYERQLGVTCVYCHATTKPGIVPRRMDFASDEKPEKNIAREMIRMTNKINKKYFDFRSNKNTGTLPPVTCKTCHRGFPRPVLQ